MITMVCQFRSSKIVKNRAVYVVVISECSEHQEQLPIFQINKILNIKI